MPITNAAFTNQEESSLKVLDLSFEGGGQHPASPFGDNGVEPSGQLHARGLVNVLSTSAFLPAGVSPPAILFCVKQEGTPRLHSGGASTGFGCNSQPRPPSSKSESVVERSIERTLERSLRLAKQTDYEGGGWQYECPNGSGNVNAAVVAAPASAAILLRRPSSIPSTQIDGSESDEGQGNDALSPLSGQSRRKVTTAVTATESPDRLHVSAVRGLPTRRNRHCDAPMS